MDELEFRGALAEAEPEFGLALSPEAIDRFCAHYVLLATWNKKLNLTRVIAPAEAARFHFLESAFLSTAMSNPSDEGRRVVDIGSGAGFPGLPLACVWPDCEFVLVEPNGKRSVFLKEAIRRLGLTRVSVDVGRYDSESVRESDVLVSRALEGLDQTLPSIVLSPAQVVALYSDDDTLERARVLSGRELVVLGIPGTANRRIGILARA